MIHLATVFSGIGAVEHALTRLDIEKDIVFACDNGERKLKTKYSQIEDETRNMNNADRNNYIKNLYDRESGKNYVEETYKANYEMQDSVFFQDAKLLDGYEYEGKVDLFVGGSPCQSFSIMGKRKGLDEARGTLFYEYARLVSEIKPKVFIYENVTGMLILLAFGLSEKEKAFYSSFHGIEHLIGAILCQEDNLAIQNIGNILLNLPVFETLENYQPPYVKLKFNTGYNKTSPERNRIIFGAPGTGKSYKLKKESLDLLRNTNGSYERVTFHPDYSYAQFVGTYKPVMGADEKIRYDFVPGPFMRVYVEALKSGRTENPQPHLLLIEEINRAKVAAVFGDVFQLLDRDDDGVSEYEIQASEDIRKYLAKQLGGTPDNYQKIRIPNNMFIWSTMNSADQGVFPMDTAFKRRWNFEYLGINENEEKISGIGKIELSGSDEPVEWNIFRRAINAKMSSDQFKINEDKLMGPFFLSKKVIASDENGMIIDTKKF